MFSKSTCKFLQALELFKPEVTENSITGYLYPNLESDIHSYGYPILEYSFHLRESDGKCHITGGIHSIDDSGVSFHYQLTSKKKALAQLKRLEHFFTDCQYMCPSKYELEEFMEQNACIVEWW